MVQQNPAHAHSTAAHSATPTRPPHAPTGARQTTPSAEQATPCGIQHLRQALKGAGLSGSAAQLITAAWRDNTQKQYRSYWSKWLHFCGQRKVAPLQASVQEVIEFLSLLFDRGLSYSSINVARSALVSLISTFTDSAGLSFPFASKVGEEVH